MRLLLALLLFCGSAQAHILAICNGDYALCAASSTTPTGKLMTINGKVFKEGVAVCPILNGKAIANMDLMNNSCKSLPNKVWSLFGVPPVTNYPQAPNWNTVPAQFRSFTIGDTPTTGMSNMWSFPCDIQAKKVNGVRLASCYGPIMESPWDGNHVKQGQSAFTQAPIGATYPVGGNAPKK